MNPWRSGAIEMSEFDELINLLKAERELLLRGQLSELAQLAAPKETLFEEVAKSIANEPKKIETVRTLASSNTELLRAAGNGVKTALAQISDAKAQNQVSVYGSSGRKIKIGSHPEQLEKRA